LENKGLRVGCFYDPGICDDCEASVKDLRQLACRREWQSPFTRLLLFLAAREELNCHLEKVAEEYDVILLDRYVTSTWAYQFLDLEDDPGMRRSYLNMLLSSTDNFIPDMLIFFDVDPKDAFERSSASARKIEAGTDVFEKKKIEFLTKLKNTYDDVFLAFLREAPDCETLLIPAFQQPEVIFMYYLHDIDKLFNGFPNQK
jgi:thymidylate kinase